MMGQTALHALVVALALFALLAAGCTTTTTPVSVSRPAVTAVPVATTISTPVPIPTEDFSAVTEVSVLAIADTWDADVDDDGVALWVHFKDANENTIYWKRTHIPIEIEIWTKKLDASYKTQKDVLVYSGRSVLTDSDSRIRIGFDEMRVPAGEEYGIALVTATTPDGRKFAGQDTSTPLRP